jgi:hypothetical protein
LVSPHVVVVALKEAACLSRGLHYTTKIGLRVTGMHIVLLLIPCRGGEDRRVFIPVLAGGIVEVTVGFFDISACAKERFGLRIGICVLPLSDGKLIRNTTEQGLILLEAKLSRCLLPRDCLVFLPRFLLLFEVLQEVVQLLLWCDVFLLLLLVFLY